MKFRFLTIFFLNNYLYSMSVIRNVHLFSREWGFDEKLENRVSNDSSVIPVVLFNSILIAKRNRDYFWNHRLQYIWSDWSRDHTQSQNRSLHPVLKTRSATQREAFSCGRVCKLVRVRARGKLLIMPIITNYF